MKKIIYIFSIVFLISIILESCGDCPVKDESPVFVCDVREGTISEFNPHLIKRVISEDSVYMEPVPRYSIHTFLFPSDKSSSGELTNDERYDSTEKIPILPPIPFSDGENYYAALVDYYPLNSTMVGDVMVLNVYIDNLTPLNNTADLKVYGSLARFPDDFYSENSDEFCAFIDAYGEEELNNIRIDATPFGASLPNARSVGYDADSNFVTLDPNWNVVDNIAVLQTDKQTLLEKAMNKSVVVKVKIGQVYFYKSRNGGQFVFVVSDIRTGTQPPFKRRVTLMFNPLK